MCYLISYKHGLLLKTQLPPGSKFILLGYNTIDVSDI